MSERPDIGAPPVLAWLPVDKLDIDPSYQRTLDTPRSQKLIAKIAAEFDWRKFGALIAAPNENDRFWLVDGQHRMEGARRRGDIRHLPAVVHRGLSLAELVEAFVGANRDRMPVSAQALFHARLVGGDPQAARLKALCDRAGITLLRYALSAKITPAGQTSAIPAMLETLRVYGDDRGGAAIVAVGECFRRFKGGLQSAFFLAAGRYLAEGGKAEGLRRALDRLGPERLAAEPHKRSGHGGAAELLALLRQEGSERPVVTDRPARKIGTALPLKAEPLPQAPAKIDPKRAGEEDAIARFLAEKGARQVMSPEQVAAFLRDAGHQATIRVAREKTSDSANIYLDKPEIWLDGRKVSLAALYQLANELRARSGLPALAMPEAVAA